ncbi:MAG: alpha/beta fold hydrolase [Actinomycetota bacterium]
MTHSGLSSRGDLTLAHRFESSSGEIAYGAFGSGRDVVLVHGTPTSSVVWRRVVARLSDSYRLHVLDLPGYGQSAKFEGQDVRLRALARALSGWLDHMGLDSPVLVGHDFGAATVLGAHLVEGAPVSAIAIADGVVLSPWGTPYSRLVKEHEHVFAAVPGYIHEATLRAHLATAVSRTLPPGLMDELIAPWLGDGGQAAYYRQVGQFDYGFTNELEMLYPDIEASLLVLWGEEDRWVDISEGARFADMVPHSEFITLPDAGHLVMLDTPSLLARSLGEWLERLDEDG